MSTFPVTLPLQGKQDSVWQRQGCRRTDPLGFSSSPPATSLCLDQISSCPMLMSPPASGTQPGPLWSSLLPEKSLKKTCKQTNKAMTPIILLNTHSTYNPNGLTRLYGTRFLSAHLMARGATLCRCTFSASSTFLICLFMAFINDSAAPLFLEKVSGEWKVPASSLNYSEKGFTTETRWEKCE